MIQRAAQMEPEEAGMGRTATSCPKVAKDETTDAPIIDFPSLGSADVAIFWDYQNVQIPKWCAPTTASESIRKKVAKYGRIVEKRLYYDSRQLTEDAALRSELDLSGFTLVDCPSRNRKETLDKKLIVDVLCFAWERASLGTKACVVLITSDGDYSYAVARLRDIGVFTVIIYRPDIVAKVLIDNANVVMSWEFQVLGGPPANEDDDDDREIKKEEQLTLSIASASSSHQEQSSNAEENEAGPVVKQPTLQTRGKFALFSSVVLNAQYRNVREGISVYASWASQAMTAALFYEKVGEKDRDAYIHIRTLATEKGVIEWGRRNLQAPGKPVIKVKSLDDQREGLSPETYVRLTYAGLAVLKPGIAAKESDWTMVQHKLDSRAHGLQEEVPESSARLSSPTVAAPNVRNKDKLFVGGLAWQTTEDSLRSYFKQFGPISHVVVLQGKGFGFVHFRHADSVEAVLKPPKNHVVDLKVVE